MMYYNGSLHNNKKNNYKIVEIMHPTGCFAIWVVRGVTVNLNSKVQVEFCLSIPESGQ